MVVVDAVFADGYPATRQATAALLEELALTSEADLLARSLREVRTHPTPRTLQLAGFLHACWQSANLEREGDWDPAAAAAELAKFLRHPDDETTRLH